MALTLSGNGAIGGLNLSTSNSVSIANTLTVSNGSYISIGGAYFSAGGDYVHLCNHAYYNGTSWIPDSSGANGGLIQISSNNINFYSGTSGSPAFTQTAGITSAGVLTFNSGYGSAVPAYGCRAFVQFNGVSGVTINKSGGVTSVTRNATGDYTVNLNFTMPDINYTVNVSKSTGYGASFVGDTMVHTVLSTNAEQAPTTTAFRFSICVWNASTTGVDGKYISVLVFR